MTSPKTYHPDELNCFPLEGWQPVQRAVLCFVVEPQRILLIEKKRGLGAGKANGPGGKIDPGETPLDAAVRETQEEIGVTPINPRAVGELFFQFTDGLSIHCTVFRSDAWTGDLIETPEAIPFWSPLDAIPYDRMWRDDQYWLPHLIDNVPFKGYFTFDGDRMLSHLIEVESDCLK